MTERSRSQLIGDLDVQVEFDAPIGARTWYGIGGRADTLVRPGSEAALAELLRRCRDSDTPLRVLGAGANLLVDDDGVDGIVVHLEGPAFQAIRFNLDGEVDRMHAMAGGDLFKAVTEATRRGLAGLERMAGIPATIGGAVRMNAGGAHGSLGEIVESVTCLEARGRSVTYPASELRFGYRATNITDPIVLAVTLRLPPEDPVTVRSRVKEIMRWKKSTQPLGHGSAGCTFRNPLDEATGEHFPAGRLIDEAGCKGLAVGGATVSPRHANFIVTDPSATARHVVALLDMVRRRVLDHCGIRLEEEVITWRRENPVA